MAAELDKLLDFNQPLDVALLDQVPPAPRPSVPQLSSGHLQRPTLPACFIPPYPPWGGDLPILKFPPERAHTASAVGGSHVAAAACEGAA